MKIPLFLILLVSMVSCTTKTKNVTIPQNASGISQLENDTQCKDALRVHLDAITAKDIATVKNTLPAPNAPMHFILPDGTQMATAGEFIKMHDDWFKDTSTDWKLDFTILYVHTNGNLGFALTEGMLTEPDRGGKPYFHKMYISYVLEKQDGKWLVIKDHASTIEKSE